MIQPLTIAALALAQNVAPVPEPPDESVSGSVEVLVTDGDTGEPIVGAEVFLVEEAETPTHGLFSPAETFTTDGEGRATASFEDARFPRLVARAEGYGVKGESFRVGPVEVELIPEQPITVEVLDYMGRPVAGAELGVAVGCGHTPDVVAATTDASGRATLRGIADHDDIVDLYVLHPDLSRSSYERVPFDEVDGDGVARVIVGPGWTVEGILIGPDGRPVAGAHVGAPEVHRGPWARTDFSGSFRLVGLPPRPVELTVRGADGELRGFFGGGRPGVARILRLVEGAMERSDPAVEVLVGLALDGRDAAEEAPVELTNVETGWSARATTGDNGQVRVEVPAGVYRMDVGGSGGWLRARPGRSDRPGLMLLMPRSAAGIMERCERAPVRPLFITGAPEGAALELRTADGAVLEIAEESLDRQPGGRTMTALRVPFAPWALWAAVEGADGVVRRTVADLDGPDGRGVFTARFADQAR